VIEQIFVRGNNTNTLHINKGKWDNRFSSVEAVVLMQEMRVVGIPADAVVVPGWDYKFYPEEQKLVFLDGIFAAGVWIRIAGVIEGESNVSSNPFIALSEMFYGFSSSDFAHGRLILVVEALKMARRRCGAWRDGAEFTDDPDPQLVDATPEEIREQAASIIEMAEDQTGHYIGCSSGLDALIDHLAEAMTQFLTENQEGRLRRLQEQRDRLQRQIDEVNREMGV
jgi:hypothetical protein